MFSQIFIEIIKTREVDSIKKLLTLTKDFFDYSNVYPFRLNDDEGRRRRRSRSRSRSPVEMELDGDPLFRACPVCTYNNERDAENCEMCATAFE